MWIRAAGLINLHNSSLSMVLTLFLHPDPTTLELPLCRDGPSDINPSVDYHGDEARALMIQSSQITTAPSNQYSFLWTSLIQTTCRNFRTDRREEKKRCNRQRLERCWLSLKISMMWPYVIKC